MPKPKHQRHTKLLMAAMSLAVPSAIFAAGAQPSETPAPAKKLAKENLAETQPPAETAVKHEPTRSRKSDVLGSLFASLPPGLGGQEASPFEPPGRPPGRPPSSPPGHDNPPNPPGQPPGRPPNR